MKTAIFVVHKNVIMKRALTLAVAAMGLSAVTANAQLPAGSIAQNWTYSDINSQSHTLYNYLDSGYTVIMDISAAWCGPCWSMHQSHVADSLTKHYGANGTIDPKKIKFFFFEGEDANTTAQLNGTSGSGASSTQGNWVANTNYSFFDNTSVKTNYPITGFPTFYVICPNRTISFVTAGYGSTMGQEAFWTAKQQACPVATQPTDGSIAGLVPEVNACPGTPITLSTMIQNMGTQPLTSATVKALVGTTVVGTQNWTGNLAKYGFATVTFPNYTPTGSGTLKYEVTVANDANAANNSKTAAINAAILAKDNILIEVKTDYYPVETSWKLMNGSAVIAQTSYTGPAAGGGVDADKVFTYNYNNLPLNACLTFTIDDQYGDGMSGQSLASTTDDGYVKITDLTTNQVIYQIGGGSYEETVSRKFKAGSTTGIEQAIAFNAIALTPNPTSGNASLTMNLVESTTVAMQVVDMTGRMVYQFPAQKMNAGAQNVAIPSSSFAAGAYQVNVVLNGNATSQRLMVTK